MSGPRNRRLLLISLTAGALVCGCVDDDVGAVCGDGVVEPTEVCDGTDFSGRSCATQGLGPGTLVCNATCDGFDNSGCATVYCGNEEIDGTDWCDGEDLAGLACADFGFDGGTLACDEACYFDVGGCREDCGDGTLDPDEACDDGNLIDEDGCTPDCRWEPTRLAWGQELPRSIVVDATDVYWLNGDRNDCRLWRVPREGGVKEVVGTESYVAAIALDTTHLYLARPGYGSVMRKPLSGGEAVELVTGQPEPRALVVDSTHVYWVNAVEDGSVMRVVLDGSSGAEVLAGGLAEPYDLAVDSTHVYWVGFGDGTVKKVPLGGGTVVTLTSGQVSPVGITVDSTHVYWTDRDALTVMKVPLAGGAPVTLATNQHYASDIAVDSTHVYWTNHDGAGAVMRIPLEGGTPLQLTPGDTNPYSLAIDGEMVFFTNETTQSSFIEPDNGSVMSFPR